MTMLVANGITWGDEAWRLLRGGWRDYRQRLQACRARRTPRRVHQLRVALRRLEARLLISRALLGSGPARKARAGVKKRLAALGALRDAQVHRQRLDEVARHHPEMRGLQNRWRRRERRLRQSCVRDLTAGKLARQVAAILTGLRTLPRQAAANRRLRARLERVLRRLQRRSSALQARTLADLTRLHRARIAFKRFHLVVEALQPFLPAMSSRELAAMARYQRLMGRVHDLDLICRRVDRSVRKGWITGRQVRSARRALLRRRRVAASAYLRATRRRRDRGATAAW